MKWTLSYPFIHLPIRVAIADATASEQPSVPCSGLVKGTKTQDLRKLRVQEEEQTHGQLVSSVNVSTKKAH